jgi:hypothetical protein
MDANTNRKPSHVEIRELNVDEIEAVAGGRWVRMLQNWWWVDDSGNSRPVKGPPA